MRSHREEAPKWLRGLPLLEGLDDSALTQISRLAQRRSYARGEMIVLEGRPCTTVHFIIEGRVKLSKVSLQGREQVMIRLGPGDAFCIATAFDGGPSPATAEASTAVVVCTLRREDFLHILRQHPRVALAALKQLADRLHHFMGLVEDLSFRTVEGRLARLLLNLAMEQDVVLRRMTQQEMAAELGTVREVIARTLKALEEEGLIRFDRHRVVIVDRASLETKALI